MFFSINIVVVLISFVNTLDNLKDLEGYAVGLMSDCPGSLKKAVIKEESLEKLTFSVMTDKFSIITYNYFQMKQLAKDSNLNFTKMTILNAGGYTANKNFLPSNLMSRKYKRLGYNVLVVDISYFSYMDYPRVVRALRPLGKHIAEMLVELTEEGLDPNKVELIGISIGAQSISFIGKNYKLLTGNSLSRITALDPAGPCFRHLGPEDRLDKSDADFVDVVAVNIGGYGMANPVGHVTFYVNGGEFQPGFIYWAYTNNFFSHIRSYILWMMALDNPKSFIAIKCDSVQQARNRTCYDRTPQETNILGLRTNRSNPGIFYLATSEGYPFHLGKRGLKKESDVFLSRLESVNKEDVLIL